MPHFVPVNPKEIVKVPRCLLNFLFDFLFTFMALWLTIDFSYTVYMCERAKFRCSNWNKIFLFKEWEVSRKCEILLSLISALVCVFSVKP